MASGKHDFDWLLDNAEVIAFDPGRLSLYAFGQDMAVEDLRERVLAPMNEAGPVFVGGRQVHRSRPARAIPRATGARGTDGVRRCRPAVRHCDGLSRQVSAGLGAIRGVVPVLARTLSAGGAGVIKTTPQNPPANTLYSLVEICYIDVVAPQRRNTLFGYTPGTRSSRRPACEQTHPERRRRWILSATRSWWSYSLAAATIALIP